MVKRFEPSECCSSIDSTAWSWRRGVLHRYGKRHWSPPDQAGVSLSPPYDETPAGRSCRGLYRRLQPPHRSRRAMAALGRSTLQARALVRVEGDRFPVAGVPAKGHDPCLSDYVVRRRQDRLPGDQAGRPNALRLNPDPHPPVLMADFRAQADLQPHNYVDRIAADDLRIEGIATLLQVRQEHHVVDVTQGISIAPPDIDRTLIDRAHTRS